MQKVYKPRYPTRNAGFWFTAVSLFLSYGIGALLVIGLMNNNQTQATSFNLGGALLVLAISGLLFVGSLAVVYRIMVNQPKQVVLEEDRLLVLDAKAQPLKLEVEIPFAALTLVRATDVPVEGGLFPASFQGLLLRWQDPVSPENSEAPPADLQYIISSRNVRDFEDLHSQVFARTPEIARGTRTFRL